MVIRRSLPHLAAALVVALALPAARAAAQDPARKDDKPNTVKQIAKNVQDESKRVYKRSEKTVRKGAKDTGKQAKREQRQIERTFSREAREKQAAEKDSTRQP